MTYRDGDLYELLPAIVRIRDAERGGPLEALVAVLGEQADVLDEDLHELYENWFIETCAPWVLPYLADLLRVHGIHDLGHRDATLRSYVANTLRYRRRKGTVAVLEALARDVTLWQARAAEFFLQLSTTQHLNHVRLANHRTPDLRDQVVLDRLDGPFDAIGHTVDVRRVDSGRGRHNIPNIGIFLWRLESYPVHGQVSDGSYTTGGGTPRPVTDPADGRYRFSPLGLDMPLFNQPDTEEEIAELADEVDVPGPLSRRLLGAESEARRQAQVDGVEVPQGFLRDGLPAFELFVQDGAADPMLPVPTNEVAVCDLDELAPDGDWRRPSSTRSYQPADGGPAVALPITVAVDPERGRLAFPAGVVPAGVRVSYSYGSAGDLGGGTYPRPDDVSGWQAPRPGSSVFVAVVTEHADSLAADPTRYKATVADAVAAWHSHIATAPGSFGVIAFADSGSYSTTAVPTVDVPEGARLAIVAADPTPGGGFRRKAVRPHLAGSLHLRGIAPPPSDDPGQVLIDGLLIEGSIAVEPGHLGDLTVSHSTLATPSGPAALRVLESAVQPGQPLDLTVDRAITGPILLGPDVRAASITESIVTSREELPAVDGDDTHVACDAVTVLGPVMLRSVEASNCIFAEPLSVQRAQVGCVRFSYVPFDAATRTPQRYRCQPDLAVEGIADPGERTRIATRVTPTFTSRSYGDPAFGQLGRSCAREIIEGAEDGTEMGAFRFLAQPQRRENLAVALHEYLRFGMTAGVFDVT